MEKLINTLNFEFRMNLTSETTIEEVVKVVKEKCLFSEKGKFPVSEILYRLLQNYRELENTEFTRLAIMQILYKLDNSEEKKEFLQHFEDVERFKELSDCPLKHEEVLYLTKNLFKVKIDDRLKDAVKRTAFKVVEHLKPTGALEKEGLLFFRNAPINYKVLYQEAMAFLDEYATEAEKKENWENAWQWQKHFEFFADLYQQGKLPKKDFLRKISNGYKPTLTDLVSYMLGIDHNGYAHNKKCIISALENRDKQYLKELENDFIV